MPNQVTDRLIKEAKYISIADYMKSMDMLPTLQEKMAFTTGYLIAHGGDKNRDVSFAEAVHIAKMKIADASAKWRKQKGIIMADEAINPLIPDEEDAPYRQFMIEPVKYLQNETVRMMMQEAQGGVTEENIKQVEKYQKMYDYCNKDLDGSLTREIDRLGSNPMKRRVANVKARLYQLFKGAKEFEKAYEATKPGWLAKAFGKYSTAYSNLEQVYTAFNNPNHVMHGDMDSLDKAATEYLKHALPRWNPDRGLPTMAAINRLSGTRKARALFSYNILKATEEQRESNEEVYDTIVNANNQIRAEREANAGDEVLNNDNFQQNIRNDLQNEEQVEENSEEAENAYHANFVDGPSIDED